MESKEGVLFYWCVNCGKHGKFEFRRMLSCNCERCNYDVVTPFEEEEIREDVVLTSQFEEVLK